MENVLGWLKNLLSSRKVWLAILGVVMGWIQLEAGEIDASAFVELVRNLIMIVIGGIALEDAAKWYSGSR